MDALKAEIAKKKRQLQERLNLEPAQKYFKRGDLIAKIEEENKEKYGKLLAAVEQPKAPSASNSSDLTSEAEHTTLPRKEVIRRLRERGEPIVMFGESEIGKGKVQLVRTASVAAHDEDSHIIYHRLVLNTV